MEDAELPRAVIKRLIKRGLQGLPGQGGQQQDALVNRDALLAFSEATQVFISYVTATASDICKESKRQTISAEDVLLALADLGFDSYVTPTKQGLEAFKQASKGRAAAKAETAKRKKDAQAAGASPAEQWMAGLVAQPPQQGYSSVAMLPPQQAQQQAAAAPTQEPPDKRLRMDVQQLQQQQQAYAARVAAAQQMAQQSAQPAAQPSSTPLDSLPPQYRTAAAAAQPAVQLQALPAQQGMLHPQP